MAFLLGPPNIEKLKAKHDMQGLIKTLDYQKDAVVRKSAAEALGQVRYAPAAPRLALGVLKDADPLVRDAAMEALVQIGDVRALAMVLAGLKFDNEETRKNAIRALRHISVEALTVMLKDTDTLISDAAEEALLQIGDTRAITALLAAHKDSQFWGREVLLRKVGAAAVEPLAAALEDSNVSAMAAELLGEIGDARAVEPLVAALKHGNKETRRNAATALGLIRDIEAVEPLGVALKDGDEEVRIKVVDALGQIGDSRAVEPLIVALKHGTLWERTQAAEALGRIKDKRAAEPLIAAFGESLLTASPPDYFEGQRVRQFQEEAAEALKALRHPRAAELRAVLKHERLLDEFIYALRCGEIVSAGKLGKLRGETRIVRLLVEWLELESDIERRASWGRAKERAQELLQSMLAHNLEKISSEDLRAVSRLTDGERYEIS
ncbi:MAG TPA: HEAT repeat domain-containing protein, partial [Anaerolineales bacterium]|nr:HEAT repeat domain-containing protein [Anaerolineales bacterium]